MHHEPHAYARRRSTKIVATIGPATSSPEALRALVQAGANVLRLNFSHGTHEDHGKRYALIREIEREVGRPLGVMADLQGPKLRVGTFAAGAVELTPGQLFRFDQNPAPGDASRVCLPHPEIFAAMAPGQFLLVDDGKVRLKVEGCGPDFLETTVVSGTRISDRKGVNVPEAVLKLAALTEKDIRDLEFALKLGVDYIALSFVQQPEDVETARTLVEGRAGIISKIEKPSAVRHLARIVELSDAIMVARGDLGVELPPEDVPAIQKEIIRVARMAGRPVIVATQMLESMISAPSPTRAEASDVANAVYDGADAVMLSAETASGQYPTEAVSIMNRVCHRIEADPFYRSIMAAIQHDHEHSDAAAITGAAKKVAQTIGAACIVTFTSSGSTALRAARERPKVPILCLTPNPNTARRMALVYGLQPVELPEIQTFAETVEHSVRVAKAEGLALAGEKLVITAGVPFGQAGTTNILRIAEVK